MKDRKTQIRPPKAKNKQTQTDPTDAVVDENLGIMHTDDNVDYYELHSIAPDPAQIDQYNDQMMQKSMV